MLSTQSSKVVDFEDIVRIQELPTEPAFHCLEATVDNRNTTAMFDSSVMVRDGLTLWLCRAGSVMTNVDGSSHAFASGQMLIVPPGTFFRISSPSPDFRCLVLIARVNEEASVASIMSTFPRLRRQPVISLDPLEEEILLSFVDYVKASIKQVKNLNRADIDRTALAILRSELVDILLRRNLAVRDVSAEEQLVNRFQQMLVTASYEHRDVVWYADQFGLTSERFAFKVQRATGRNPRDFIADAVIKTAKNLLRGTTLSTGEISRRMNFPSASSFCRYFRRYTEQTPQEWRIIEGAIKR